MRVRKPLRPSVMPIEKTSCLCLSQNHQSPIEPFDSIMSIADLPGDLIQRDTVLVENGRNVFGFSDGVPVLGAVDVFESDVFPNLIPAAFDNWQCFQLFFR